MTASKRKGTPRPKAVEGFVRDERRPVIDMADSAWSRVARALEDSKHYTDEEKALMLPYLRDAYDRFPLSFDNTPATYLLMGAGITARTRLKEAKN